MRKINFIIAVHQFDYGSGGNTVLHRLAKILQFKGHTVFTFGKGDFGFQYNLLKINNYNNESRNWQDFNENTEIITSLDKNNTIVIVPESFSENKIDILENYGKILVWGLTHNSANLFNFYNNNNRLYFYYSPGFNKYNYKQDGILEVTLTDYLYWSNSSNIIKNSNSVCFRKASYYNLNEEYINSSLYNLNKISNKEILNFDSYCPHFLFDPMSKIKRNAKSIFNKTEYFVSFDNNCFFSVQAALSGCNSVIIPNPNAEYTPKQFREKYPLFAKGVAYGFNDLDHMFRTKNEIVPYMKEIESKNKNNIDEMIKICLQYL